MSIGSGIFMMAVGAILVFALDVSVDFVNLDTVGYILMIAGAVTLIIGIALLARKRRSVATTHTQVDPASGASISRQESSVPEL